MKLPWRPKFPKCGAVSGDCKPIQTSLTDRETDALMLMATGGHVLEIGSAYGYTTVNLATVAEYVVTVDHHQHMDTLEPLQRNLISYQCEGNVDVVVGDSQQAEVQKRLFRLMGRNAKSGFDLAFIDGDHSKDGVFRDFRLCSRLVRQGGLITFHDYGEESCPEVKQAIDALFPTKISDGKFTLTDTLFVVRNTK